MRHCPVARALFPHFSLIGLLILALVGSISVVEAAGEGQVRTPDAKMLRFPDVSADSIAFVYAGDIWTVPRAGGLARRLTSSSGKEMFPKFSPDGRTIAFSGNYDGNIDIYTMPAMGGSPKRVTHHPSGDYVIEFYPGGDEILYRSRMYSPSTRFSRLFRVSVAGGLPEQLPFPYGELAALSADANDIALQFISREGRTWKRYRGGMASDIWLYNFVDNTSRKLTNFDGTDAVPMWHGEDIYFLSDRDNLKKLNIWAHNLKTRKTRQVTKFTEYDVKWPSIGPDAIVFENAGILYLLDIKTAEYKPVEIQVPHDLPEVRTQIKSVSDNIRDFNLSPSAQRAVFEARGEIFTVPAKNGSVRNITNTSGVAERFPAWSPDGRYVAYFSDRTGEYELHIRPADGSGEQRQITDGGSAFRYKPVWSPDSRKIAFSDKTGSLFVVEVKEQCAAQFVDKDEWSEMDSYTWSPDSRYLAYSKKLANRNASIMIFDTSDNRARQITSDYYSDTLPVFSTDGKYLFFRSNRSFSPVYGDMDYTWIYPNSGEIFVVTLDEETESPTAPLSDEEEPAEDEKADKEADDDPNEATPEEDNAGQAEEADEDAIDFDRIEERIVKLPIDAGDLTKLRTVKDRVIYLRKPPAGASDSSSALCYYDIEDREEETIMTGVDNYEVAADGKKLIYKAKSTYGIVAVAGGKSVGNGKLDTGDLKAWINPREEWAQIFNEAWRIERDYFYDPNMHGLDWDAIRLRYKKLLPFIIDRDDLNYVIGEMIGELNASHAYVRNGDLEDVETIPVGLLGCDFVLDAKADAYQISRVYSGAVWDVEDRSPLRRPGIKVKPGDYLLAVNGRKLDTSKDPWASFQGLAKETVTLTIAATADGNDTREIIVEPLSSERSLRNRDWIEANRLAVQEATNNRVGYIYVPDTGRNGQNELVRQFTAQWNKDALIIDERFNAGGQIPDRFIELLNRPIYNYWARRDNRDWRTPFVAHNGPKVMLINGWSGSGGDAFPYYFRKAGIGPLIGTRTWGGLIGISGNPRFIDGGYISAPTFGFWNTEGQWEVEGYGVDPDYELENMPHELAQGLDPQLDKAIEVVMDMLKEEPPSDPPKPAYPDRSDSGN